MNKAFVRLSAVCLCLLQLMISGNAAYSFDFKRDVASKFFWTKAYKEKHPAPVNKMPKTMNEYYREVNKAADKAQDIPPPRFEKDDKLVDLPDPVISLEK